MAPVPCRRNALLRSSRVSFFFLRSSKNFFNMVVENSFLAMRAQYRATNDLLNGRATWFANDVMLIKFESHRKALRVLFGEFRDSPLSGVFAQEVYRSEYRWSSSCVLVNKSPRSGNCQRSCSERRCSVLNELAYSPLTCLL